MFGLWRRWGFAEGGVQLHGPAKLPAQAVTLRREAGRSREVYGQTLLRDTTQAAQRQEGTHITHL